MEKPCEGCTVISEGYEAGRKERDALRAEVEVMRRAQAIMAENASRIGGCIVPNGWAVGHCGKVYLNCPECLTAWAISEARKGEHE